MNTATNRASRWLFPGRRAGQPIHPDALVRAAQRHRHPDHRRPHRRDPPARPRDARPVVADALGYHRVTTAKLASAGRRHLEPIRRRRPLAVTTRLDPTEQYLNMRSAE